LFTFTIRSRTKISQIATGQKKAEKFSFFILSSRLARTRRDLAESNAKKSKIPRNFAKKVKKQQKENT